MPPQEHPNADAIVQKTLASIEQLAVHWMATRMEALKAIEDKPLDSTPAKGLDGLSSMGVVNPPPMPNHIITNWNDGGYYAAQSNAGATASNVDKLSAEQAATIAGNPTEYGKTGLEIDSQTAQYSLPPLASGQPSWDDVRVASNDPSVVTGLQSRPEFSRDAIQTGDVASAPVVDNSLTVHDNSMDSYTSQHTSAPIVAPTAAPESSRIHANLAQDSYASPAVEDSAAVLAYREQEARANADGQQVIMQDQPLKVPDQTIQTSSSTLTKDAALPPHTVNMPNADALVAKTLASVEQLAVHWMATRVEALKAIEDKPLDAAPAKGLDGVPSMGVVNPPSIPNHIVTGWSDGGYYAAQSDAGANAANVDKLSAEQAATLAGNPTEYGERGVENDPQAAQYSLPPLVGEDQRVAPPLHSALEFSRDSIQTSDVASQPVVDNSLTVHDNSMDSYTSHHTNAPSVSPEASKVVNANRAENTNAAPIVEDSSAILAYRESEARTKADAPQVNKQDDQLKVPDKTIESTSSALSKEMVLPPQNANMPNADAIVQKTLDSLEHLAVQWLATRVQALDAIEDKGLSVTPGNILGEAASTAAQSPPPTPDQPFANLNTSYYPAANLNKLTDTPVAPPPMLADAPPDSTLNLENANSPRLLGEILTGTVAVAPESVLAKETVFQQNTGTTPSLTGGPTLHRIDQTYKNAGMTVENYNKTPVAQPVATTPSVTPEKGSENAGQSKVDRPVADKPTGEEKGAFFGKILDVSNRPTNRPIVGPPPSHDKANIKKVLDKLQNGSDKESDSEKTDQQLPSWMKW
ncbi:unnamed protein product [Sphagnum balticum]